MKLTFKSLIAIAVIITILISSCQKTPVDYSKDINDLKALVTELQHRSDSLAAALGNTNTNLSNLSKSVDSIKVKLTDIQTQIDALTLSLTTANENIAAINAQLVLLNQQYASLLAQLNAILALLNTAPPTLQDGLLAYYPFSGNANDSSGNLNDGSIFGALLSNDRFGKSQNCYSFNSGLSYVRTKSVLQNISNNFSISVWVNPSNNDILKTEGITGSENTGIMSVIAPAHGENWGLASQNAGVGLNVGLNQIQVVEHSHLYIASPLVYQGNLSGWNHILVIYENHLPKLYINGKFIKEGLISSMMNVRPSNGYCSAYSQTGFGSSFNPNGSPIGQFSGSIDDIRIYNRALTQSEITYLATH